jgi:hypothetical protein
MEKEKEKEEVKNLHPMDKTNNLWRSYLQAPFKLWSKKLPYGSP